ncbi:DNA translocase FtsK [Nitratiruptor sp. YY09-18]|uniref:DNA translocase FtsK n=1 Tax=Nitratiruptor sp. YY09-18 TaxID=2724901 RepID=UPI00351C820D
MGVSTIFMDFHFVGKLGTSFGKFNRETFGALAFIYPFLFLYPLFITYKKKLNAKEMLSFSVMLLLTFFTLLLIQALLLPKGYDGKIGAVVIAFFTPFIGTIGVWFLVMLLVGLLYFLFQQEIKLLIHKKYTKERLIIDEKVSIKKEKIEPLENDQKEQEKRVVHEIQNQLREKKPSIKLVKNPFASQESQENTEIKKVKKQVKLVNEKEKLQKASGLTSSSATSVKPATKEMQEAQESFNKRPTQVKIVSELEENRKFLESIEKGSFEKPQDFLLPKIEFLQPPPKKRSEINETVIDKKVQELIEKLKQFKIEGDVVRTYSGPLVTTFEFKPAPHIKVSKILNLADDLAMALRAQTIRIQAPIPGKDVVGIEIPNDEFETIYLREIIESDIFKKAASPLTLALGKDIVGKPFVTDLKKLPHLLIAGTTGSGKSVGINAMLVSLLYRNSPDRLKLMMIDPKMLEFSIYNDIPHLLTPVITNSKQAIVALSNMVAEMERRYRLMSQYKTKNIEGFNKKAKKEGLEELPYIVVIIDELADLMMTSGKDVEYSIARLAQMARAAGIHLIVATQRPSVDVVTGLIKANLPSRISFRVGQKIDSKVILDSIGAESLLGRGDMLFTPPGSTGLIRLHAPWISEEEIEKIVEFLKAQREPQYDEKFLAESLESGSSNGGRADNDELDELYEEAKKIVLSERKTSISYLQRRLQIGYNRAARIVEQLENMGVLSAPNAKGNREILL